MFDLLVFSLSLLSFSSPLSLTDNQIYSQQPSSAVVCSRWPICSRGEKCKYHHPQLPCLAFPNCPFANECLLIHPAVECPDGTRCKKVKCNFVHPPTETRNSRGTICKYHPKCTNRECPYLHPDTPSLPTAPAVPKGQNMTPCKYGVLCTRADCYFLHPEMKILPQTGGYSPTPCRHGPHCTTTGCLYLHDPILISILNRFQQSGTNTLVSIGLTLEQILPMLAACSSASLIPAVNPSVLAVNKGAATATGSSPPPPAAAPQFSFYNALYQQQQQQQQQQQHQQQHQQQQHNYQRQGTSIDDEMPYLPSENSPHWD